MLKIFNSLTKTKEIFKHKKKETINMYVCGVTVHDMCHLGHGRTFIFFDIVKRYLQCLGYKVNYIRNITDIDDKIIKKSIINKESVISLTNRMILHMKKDLLFLNNIPPTQEPKASNHITHMINMIQKLIKLKSAYIAKNGDVMFSISSYKNYGLLSNQSLSKLKYGNRIRKNNLKKCLLDFVLWKKSKNIKEYSWLSPWGYGRPGWHIECSAINKFYFRDIIHIHGGGSDLIFPHHENELAQSMCLDKKFTIKFWMHVGIVISENKKISKSINNLFSLKKLNNKYGPDTIRYFLLSTHYRHPLYYTENKIKKTKILVKKLYKASNLANDKIMHDTQRSLLFKKKFFQYLNNDFNTPQSLNLLVHISNIIKKTKKNNINEAIILANTLKKLAKQLGIFFKDSIYLSEKYKIKNKDYIKFLIKERNKYRKNKIWNLSDFIRKTLVKLGLEINDKKKTKNK
ncbi:cysteine--tRNA ligase [Buchnera aphidicola (Taiwanaphis decaspermi)]|uniref:cysteine--tRNA ligase n=1 Tax=Buchnera aphidicola TaxID=9 RepID=UPI0031B7ED5D